VVAYEEILLKAELCGAKRRREWSDLNGIAEQWSEEEQSGHLRRIEQDLL